jgi:outer membrane lipoprotein-sorting protein
MSYVKHILLKTATLLLLIAGYSAYAQSPVVQCEQVFTNMFNAIKTVKTIKYNLYANERIESKYVKANSTVKVNVSPVKVYYKDLKKGIEVLWLEGHEDNDAIVNPNGFPYVNLHLDPNGKLMHKDQHQTIDRLGFAYVGNVLYHSLIQFPDAYKKYVNYAGDSTWDGYSCYKMEINFPDFHYYKIMVQGNKETVNTVADKYYLNNYLVLSLNHLSSYEDEIKAGTQLLVPNGYAKRTIILIRKDNNLPVYIKVYDDKGLLEEYGFTKLQVNPTIDDMEFTENYTGYHF